MMEYIVGLYKLNMLPESILLMEAEDPESARRRIPRPSNKARNSSAGSMLSRAFSQHKTAQASQCGLYAGRGLQQVPLCAVQSWPWLHALLCRSSIILAGRQFRELSLAEWNASSLKLLGFCCAV